MSEGSNVDSQEELFRELWAMGPLEMPAKEIARRLGVSKTHVHTLRRQYGLAPRERRFHGKPKVSVDIPRLFRLWHMPPSQMPTAQIAKLLGIGESTLYSVRKKHKLPDRERVYVHEDDDPTEEEIAERAAAIRASWPEGEAERRMVGPRQKRWSPPSYMYDGRDCSYSALV